MSHILRGLIYRVDWKDIYCNLPGCTCQPKEEKGGEERWNKKLRIGGFSGIMG
jgi:hypothetical protein